MFTRNFSKYLIKVFKPSETVTVKLITGSNATLTTSNVSAWSDTGNIGSAAGARKVMEVGIGTTEPTVDDVSLENYTSGVLGRYTTTVSIDSNGNAYCQFNVTITNSNNESVTVTEYGLMLDTSSSAGASSDRNYSFLVYRGLFSEPITINSNSSFNFVFVERIPFIS